MNIFFCGFCLQHKEKFKKSLLGYVDLSFLESNTWRKFFFYLKAPPNSSLCYRVLVVVWGDSIKLSLTHGGRTELARSSNLAEHPFFMPVQIGIGWTSYLGRVLSCSINKPYPKDTAKILTSFSRLKYFQGLIDVWHYVVRCLRYSFIYIHNKVSSS